MKIPEEYKALWQQRSVYVNACRARVVEQAQHIRLIAERESETLRNNVKEIYSDIRKTTIDGVAEKCAWFITARNDIRIRIEEILVQPIMSAQTKRPVQIKVEGGDEYAWLFFRTTHPVLNTGRLTFDGSHSQLNKQTPMVKELFRIPGVAEVALFRYDVRITKGSLFTVDEISPKILAVLNKYLV